MTSPAWPQTARPAPSCAVTDLLVAARAVYVAELDPQGGAPVVESGDAGVELAALLLAGFPAPRQGRDDAAAGQGKHDAAGEVAEVILTTDRHVHLVRYAPSSSRVLYVVLDRRRGTLAEARRLVDRMLAPQVGVPPRRVAVSAMAPVASVATVDPTDGRLGTVIPLPRRDDHRVPLPPRAHNTSPRRGWATVAQLPVRTIATDPATAEGPDPRPPLDGAWSADVDVLQRVLTGLRKLA